MKQFHLLYYVHIIILLESNVCRSNQYCESHTFPGIFLHICFSRSFKKLLLTMEKTEDNTQCFHKAIQTLICHRLVIPKPESMIC